MKYLSVVAFAVLLSMSWWLYTKKQGLSSAQQTRMQMVLQDYLTVYMNEKEPNASEIQDAEVVTRIVEPGKKMEADFKFHFFEPGPDGSQNKVVRQGQFVITSENGQDWTARMEFINESGLEFAEPLEIPREKLSKEEIEAVLGEDAAAAAPTEDAPTH